MFCASIGIYRYCFPYIYMCIWKMADRFRINFHIGVSIWQAKAGPNSIVLIMFVLFSLKLLCRIHMHMCLCLYFTYNTCAYWLYSIICFINGRLYKCWESRCSLYFTLFHYLFNVDMSVIDSMLITINSDKYDNERFIKKL